MQKGIRVRAIVTGASGFIGGHLVERLLAEGLHVVALARSASDTARLANLGIELHRLSLTDQAALADVVRKADYVFHVAGLTRARSTSEYLAANEAPTRGLLSAVARAAPTLRRFVYVSSLAAAGPTPGPVPLDESSPCRPLGGYGASKLAAERAVAEHGRQFPVTIVRPPAVYGPGDRNFLSLFRTAARYGVVPAVGGVSKQVSMIHAADLARGMWLAASRTEAAGRTYFLTGGIHDLQEMRAALAAALDRKLRLLSVPSFVARLIGELGELRWTLTGQPQIVSRRKIRDMLQPRWTCRGELAERELGFRPLVGLLEGMQQTSRWYVANDWLQPLDQRPTRTAIHA
jgi:nucleoside-diphosphate-sugar epimerase